MVREGRDSAVGDIVVCLNREESERWATVCCVLMGETERWEIMLLVREGRI